MSEARHKLLRDAPSASSTSLRRWVWQGIAVLTQAVRDLFVDGGPQWAAAIACYSLLSAFPLLLAGASIAAFFVDPQRAVAQATELLAAFVPRGLLQIEAIVIDAIAARESVGLLSLAALL
jgi:uncharacterized BrkB/YihY/UPF0761 family membrane protein